MKWGEKLQSQVTGRGLLGMFCYRAASVCLLSLRNRLQLTNNPRQAPFSPQWPYQPITQTASQIWEENMEHMRSTNILFTYSWLDLTPMVLLRMRIATTMGIEAQMQLRSIIRWRSLSSHSGNMIAFKFKRLLSLGGEQLGRFWGDDPSKWWRTPRLSSAILGTWSLSPVSPDNAGARITHHQGWISKKPLWGDFDWSGVQPVRVKSNRLAGRAATQHKDFLVCFAAA